MEADSINQSHRRRKGQPVAVVLQMDPEINFEVNMPSMWSPDNYMAAARFAAEAHHITGARVPGTRLPYFYHVTLVAMETIGVLGVEAGHDGDLAVQCALLHDVLEDTAITAEALSARFGPSVPKGVEALTKDTRIANPPSRLADSLARIQRQPSAIWVVKLADRIVNLQPPPEHWEPRRVARYRDGARQVLDTLGTASPYLADRLARKIHGYGRSG